MEYEERIDNLEVMIGRMILENDRAERRQEKAMAELRALIARIEQQRAEEARLRAEEDHKRAEEDRKRAEEDRKRAEEDRKRAEEDRKRAEEDRRNWNKKWGELSDKLGTIVEDIVAPNIPRIALELFGQEPDDLMVRRTVRNHRDPSRRREFDVVAVCGDWVLLNETKSSVRLEYIDRFVEVLAELPDYFPEYASKTIVPLFSSLGIPPDFVNYLSKRGIYAMAMGDDTMELLNRAEVEARKGG